MEYEQYLKTQIPEKDSLRIVKREAEQFYKTHDPDSCLQMGQALYRSDNFQVQEVGVLLAGYAASQRTEALDFLKDTVSGHNSWKVQEVLAMAFDCYCRKTGYEAALPVIEAWLASPSANVRRAATEGLRVWTSRPYFQDHPQAALALLAAHRQDESEYVRKSVGNAIRDISKKHGELVAAELRSWDLSTREVRQVYKLAGRFLGVQPGPQK